MRATIHTEISLDDIADPAIDAAADLLVRQKMTCKRGEEKYPVYIDGDAHELTALYDDHSTLVGAALTTYLEEPNITHILKTAIHPDYQWQGYGTMLMKLIAEQAAQRTDSLLAVANETDAIAVDPVLLQHLGFIAFDTDMPSDVRIAFPKNLIIWADQQLQTYEQAYATYHNNDTEASVPLLP